MERTFGDVMLPALGLMTAAGLYAAYGMAKIKRELRTYAYLQRDDPAAFDALVRAHRPQYERCVASLVAMIIFAGLTIWAGIADWRSRVAEADRLKRSTPSQVAPPGSAPEDRDLTFDRYAVRDGGRALRIYYHAPLDECVLSRVTTDESADEVEVDARIGLSVPAGRAGGTPLPSCLSIDEDPNRYFDVRLTTALNGRAVRDANGREATEVSREPFG